MKDPWWEIFACHFSISSTKSLLRSHPSSIIARLSYYNALSLHLKVGSNTVSGESEGLELGHCILTTTVELIRKKQSSVVHD